MLVEVLFNLIKTTTKKVNFCLAQLNFENLPVFPPTPGCYTGLASRADGNNRFWVEVALWGGFCLLSPGRSRFRCDPPPWKGRLEGKGRTPLWK